VSGGPGCRVWCFVWSSGARIFKIQTVGRGAQRWVVGGWRSHTNLLRLHVDFLENIEIVFDEFIIECGSYFFVFAGSLGWLASTHPKAPEVQSQRASRLTDHRGPRAKHAEARWLLLCVQRQTTAPGVQSWAASWAGHANDATPKRDNNRHPNSPPTTNHHFHKNQPSHQRTPPARQPHAALRVELDNGWQV
jgi:hypothetical protein